MSRPSNYIQPAPSVPNRWSVRNGNQVWFAGKMVFAVEFRPDIKRPQQQLAMQNLELLLNTSSMGPLTLMGEPPLPNG